MAKLVTAYIGLGGNIGDVLGNMNNALLFLSQHDQIAISAFSKVYKTPPWGMQNQDWFLNACVSIKTDMSAHDLLRECLAAEHSLKRIREVRWGPRTIDLDVLTYGEEKIDEDDLQVPHPRMHERAFVLLPLADIAPNFKLRGKTISSWVKKLETRDIQKTKFELTL